MSELNIKLICPNIGCQVEVSDLPVLSSKYYALSPFDELTISFLDSISKKILSDKSINYYPEIVALGFWIRKSNIKQFIKENDALVNRKEFKLSPLGKILHVCPANVDTMFLYSLAISLLIGNKNILRISGRMKTFQILRLFNIINEVINEKKYNLFLNYINIIRYNHSDKISNYLSLKVNARIIWGGDQTVKTFKQFSTSPRNKDIVFADRVSVFFLNCDSYIKLSELGVKQVISLFFNDAYWFDQLGCSSPQTIYFIGDNDVSSKCLARFQNDLISYLPAQYENDIESLASLKLNRMVDDAIDGIIIDQRGNSHVKFLALRDDTDESGLHGCGGGYFYHRIVEDIDDVKVLSSPKIQTITYWGLTDAELNKLKELSLGEGIDRIVPLGEALAFHYIWDGYNLFDELSRKIYIK